MVERDSFIKGFNFQKIVVFFFCLLAFVFLLGKVFTAGRGLWINNGIPVCTARKAQLDPQIVTDGANGAIIVWHDLRFESDYDIYAQRIDESGKNKWGEQGIPVYAGRGNQWYPQAVPDLSGGAIITWQDFRSESEYDIYAQRISGNGDLIWGSAGVPICTAPGNQRPPQIISDNQGGAIITWHDDRIGNFNIYAQRVTEDGTVLWMKDGVTVCDTTNIQAFPKLATDGMAGAIIVWEDYRNGNDFDIYAQRVNYLGNAVWRANGISICSASNHQRKPVIISDGVGGAIISWIDYRNNNADIYAQRVDGNGNLLWSPTSGVAICTARNAQTEVQICPDGAGGAIFVWQDLRSGEADIYAQRVDSLGNILWQSDGIPICTAPGSQVTPKITKDGSNHYTVVWVDRRNATTSGDDIFAQRINLDGASLWERDGIPVCTVPNNQVAPSIISDGLAGAIVTWCDFRSAEADIYAQRVLSMTSQDIPDIKLLPNAQLPSAFDLDLYEEASVATWRWSHNGNLANVRINYATHIVDYLSPLSATVGEDTVFYTAVGVSADNSILKYSTYLFTKLPSVVLKNGVPQKNGIIDLKNYITKSPGAPYPSNWGYQIIVTDPQDEGKLIVSVDSIGVMQFSATTSLGAPVKVVVTVTADTAKNSADWDKELIYVYENLINNGTFDTDTSVWQYQIFADAPAGMGNWSWVPSFGTQSGVLKISQTPGQKMKVSQLIAVKPNKWYTLRAKIATDIPTLSNTQKVYLHCLTLAGESTVPQESIAEAIQPGNLVPYTWTGLECSFYSRVTQVGISVISINPDTGVTGNLYIDEIELIEAEPPVKKAYGATKILLANTNFASNISGWYYAPFGNSIDMGSVAWDTGIGGKQGVLKITQEAGNKILGAQWLPLNQVQVGRSLLGSFWIYSNAPSRASTQKTYVLLQVYTDDTTKLITNIQNAFQSGTLTPNNWTEVKVAGIPKNEVVSAAFVVITPGIVTVPIEAYIDDIRFEADQDLSYYWDHTLFQ